MTSNTPASSLPPISAAQWAAEFQQHNDREPTMREYQVAINAGIIVEPPSQQTTASKAQPAHEPTAKPTDPTVEQMATGAKQLATGARDFFKTRVAPAIASATNSAQKAVKTQIDEHKNGTGTGVTRASRLRWAPIVLPVAAFVAIISLFLPIASVNAFGFSVSVNFFSRDADGGGVVMLIMLIITGALGVAALLRRSRGLRITAAIIGIILGGIVAIIVLATLANISSVAGYGASAGVGIVLVTVAALAVIVSAVATLIPVRKASNN